MCGEVTANEPLYGQWLLVPLCACVHEHVGCVDIEQHSPLLHKLVPLLVSGLIVLQLPCLLFLKQTTVDFKYTNRGKPFSDRDGGIPYIQFVNSGEQGFPPKMLSSA